MHFAQIPRCEQEIEIDKCYLLSNRVNYIRISCTWTNQVSTRSRVLIKVPFHFPLARPSRADLIAFTCQQSLGNGESFFARLRAIFSVQALCVTWHCTKHKRPLTSVHGSSFPIGDRTIYRNSTRAAFANDVSLLPSRRALSEYATSKRVRKITCVKRCPTGSTMRPPLRRSAVNCRVPRAATARHREW